MVSEDRRKRKPIIPSYATVSDKNEFEWTETKEPGHNDLEAERREMYPHVKLEIILCIHYMQAFEKMSTNGSLNNQGHHIFSFLQLLS